MDEHRRRFRMDFGRSASHVPAAPANITETSAPHHATHQPKAKKLGIFFGRKWLLALIVVLIAGLGALAYGYIHTKDELNKAKNPAVAGKTEAEQITNVINKIVAVPTGETPTLATVSDVSKLKTQTFFKNAQNGDKVLIYSRSGQAILYRPSTKQVIEYAPVNLGANK